MKLFSYTYCDEGEYGINCGVVFADSLDDAILLIASWNGKIEFTDKDVAYVRDTYNFQEIPIEEGATYIGGYTE